MTDKYDGQAAILLPCNCTLTQEITNGSHFMSCPFWFRPPVAAALREKDAEIERLRNGYDYVGVEGRACPGCVYDAGVFVRHCALHAKIERYKTQHQQYVKLEAEQDEEIESLRVEIKRLRTMSTVEMMCENENVKFHVIEWENRCLKAEAVIREKDAEIERLKKQLESTSQRSAWSAP